MLTCPNINTKEWKDLVSLIGEKGAFKEYIKKGTGEIPSAEEVDLSMYNESLVQVDVKELFDSNPELANEVYKTLGFKEYSEETKNKLALTERLTDIFKDKTTVLFRAGEDAEEFYVDLVKTSDNRYFVFLENQSATEISEKEFAENIKFIDGQIATTEEKDQFINNYLQIADLDQISENPLLTKEEKLEAQKDILKKVTPEQKQQALETYAQYLNTGKKDIDGFKEFVSNQGKPLSDVLYSREGFEEKALISQNIINTLASVVSQNIGVKYEIVTPNQAREITKNAKIPWNGEKGFFYNNRVYILEGHFNAKMVLHEFSHPLVEAIATHNPKLFNKLIEDLAATQEGQQIVKEVTELYPEFESRDQDDFRKEVLVRALTESGQRQLKTDVAPTSAFKNVINKILFAIKQALRAAFGNKVKVENLSENTTLEELAKMLQSEMFDVNTEEISDKDYVEYARDSENLFKALNSVEDSDISHTIDRYYELISTQIRQLSNRKSSAMRKTLLDELTNKGLLQEVKQTLEATPEISKEIEEILRKKGKEVEIRASNVRNFVHAIQRLDIITKKVSEHLVELVKENDTVEVMNNVFYYSLLVRNWDKFIKETNIRLFDNGLDVGSEFARTLSTIQTRVDVLSRQINKAYLPGVIETLKESLAPLKQGIENMKNAQIEKIKNRPSGDAVKDQKAIDAITEKWAKMELTDEKLYQLLSGLSGDTNQISVYLEAYTNQPDPILGGFAVFLKNTYNVADAEAQRNSVQFMKDMDPLLKKAGYSRTNFTDLMKKTAFKDDEFSYDPVTGKTTTKKVWTFLNPFKNTKTKLKEFRYKHEAAKLAGDKAEEDRILKEWKQHKKDYFHQEYTDEFYKREEVYDSLDKNPDLSDLVYSILNIDPKTATAADKVKASEFYDLAAKEVYYAKQLLLNQIKELDGLNYNEEYYDEVAKEKEVLWQEYSQLASMTDLNGDRKQGQELLMAKIEKKYRKVSNEFFEFVPIKGQFEFALQSYEQSLIDQKIAVDSDEFIEKRNKWIKDNTVIKYTDQFYEDRNAALTKLKKVLERIPDNIRVKVDSTGEMEEILDAVVGYRDQNGQIMGNDLPANGIDRIRDLQKSILEKKKQYATFSGLTEDELNVMHYFLAKLQGGEKLTAQEQIELDDLLGRKAKFEVDKATRTEISSLYKQLSDIQSREATDYYVNILNNWLTKLGKPSMVDNDSAGDILHPSVYTELLDESPEFKAWFEKNHIAKEIFDKKEGKTITVYERLFIWNRVRPNDPKYFENTTLASGEVVPGVPNRSYFYRTVKDKYRTQKVVGKTVDNKGNWLPKTLAEGAKDDYYINKEYDKLRQADPTAFAVLEKMKEYHLKFQESLPYESRLYLETPRYRSMTIENIKNRKDKNVNFTKRFWLNLRSMFVSSKDNFEDGLNPESLVAADLFDEEVRKVPVTGMYDLESDEVSMNFLDGIMRYMHSGLHQKKLIEANPFAQSLLSILENPDNNISATNKFVKSIYIKTGRKVPIKAKYQSHRAKAARNLYNREFLGERIADKTFNMPALWKFKSVVSKIASLGAFGLNIPSAIKNRQAAVVEAFIEAGGGQFMNLKSYGRGKIRAWKIMAEHSNQIYLTKNKSFDVQLAQIFDVGQDFLSKTIETQYGRSIADDTARLTFLMSPRKFLQMEGTMEIMCGMLYHAKVKQTINGVSRELPYIDAFEMRNGQIEVKPGIDQEWAPGGVKFNEIKNRIHEVGNRLEGTYAKFDQPEIDRYFIGQAIRFMKKYFTSMFLNHFAVRRPSAALGTVSMGNFSSLAYIVAGIKNHGPRYFMWMSPDEQAAFHKTIMTMANLIAFYMTLSLVFDYDPEDKDRFKKMRKRQVDKNGNFVFEGWLKNQGAVLTLQTLTEVETFTNPKIFKNTAAELIKPGALIDLGLSAPTNILYHGVDAIADNPSGFYKNDVGPYWFQKKGAPKVFSDAARIFGITGSTIDPVKAMKSTENTRKGLFK